MINFILVVQLWEHNVRLCTRDMGQTSFPPPSPPDIQQEGINIAVVVSCEEQCVQPGLADI